jgi:pimeloyl-ACP methyl ester carboxylesterase
MIDLIKLPTHHGEIHVLQGGTGQDVVFLHGATGLEADNPFLLKLVDKYRVTAPLLPGFGKSDECTSIRDMQDVTLHTLDVLEALGLKKPILAGHSMGGMIAAEMAAVAPNEVDKLVLIAAAGLWIEEHPSPDIFSLLPKEFPPLLFHDADFGQRMMTADIDISDPAFLIPFLVNNSRQMGMAGKFLFPIPERGLKERIHRIKARTVLVWGDSDRIFPAPYAHAFKDAIPGAELVIVAEAGHMVPVEKPDPVIAAIGRLA